MKIGILRETKIPVDTRVPFTPKQCRQVEEEFPGTEIYIQPSTTRCFSDAAYEKERIPLLENVDQCDVLFGVKEADPRNLIRGKTYFIFSHTIKKQSHNRLLLKTVLDKHVRLIDYELLTDAQGIRLIGFGRWAGLIGAYHGIRAVCSKFKLHPLPQPQEFNKLEAMMDVASGYKLPGLRIVLTGDGRVAGGAEEMMNSFGIQKVSVQDYLDTTFERAVYVQLDPEKYNKRRSGEAFELKHFFGHPRDYESIFARFYPKTDLLIMGAYWDPHAPVLFTNEQMKHKDFNISVIADISCDLNGSVPSTIKTTSFTDPYYDYNPFTRAAIRAFSEPSYVTVMAIDNLPGGMPGEASTDFGKQIMMNIMPLLVEGDPEQILERATIAKKGHLSENYRYLSDWVTEMNGL